MKKIKKIEDTESKQAIVIPTRFGSFYLEATQRGLYQLRFPGRVMLSLLRPFGPPRNDSIRYLRQAKKLLQNYLHGKSVSFHALKFDLSDYTPFECNVLMALSKVRRGELKSYAELARTAGRPRAGRAVGAVMRKNRLPIILPCHRIVHSNGKLGGYSQGLVWKKRFMKWEGLL